MNLEGNEEKSIQISKLVGEVLFLNLVKPDLESAAIGGTVTIEDIYGKYDALLDHSCIWEDVKVRVDQWKAEELCKYSRADSVTLKRIFEKHKRLPAAEKIEKVLGPDMAMRYKTALEDLESVLRDDVNDRKNSKGERWKMKSLEIVYSLVVDVLRPTYGTGRLHEEYEKWRKSTYLTMDMKREAEMKRKFWRSTGVWIVSKSDEDRWLLHGAKYGPAILMQIKKLIKICKTFRRIVKVNRNHCLRYIPKKKPSPRTLTDIDSNCEKILCYLRGCGVRKRELLNLRS